MIQRCCLPYLTRGAVLCYQGSCSPPERCKLAVQLGLQLDWLAALQGVHKVVLHLQQQNTPQMAAGGVQPSGEQACHPPHQVCRMQHCLEDACAATPADREQDYYKASKRPACVAQPHRGAAIPASHIPERLTCSSRLLGRHAGAIGHLGHTNERWRRTHVSDAHDTM